MSEKVRRAAPHFPAAGSTSGDQADEGEQRNKEDEQRQQADGGEGLEQAQGCKEHGGCPFFSGWDVLPWKARLRRALSPSARGPPQTCSAKGHGCDSGFPVPVPPQRGIVPGRAMLILTS